jgi:glycosyltransferase involved in cell wall biosynthesis
MNMSSGIWYDGVEIPRAPGKLGRGLRVLMTVDAAGGVWDYALQLARALAPQGIEIALASMGSLPTAPQRAGLRDISHVVLCESEYKLEWMTGAWRDVEAAGAWLLELESYVRPSIIHLNGYCHANLPWRAPSLVVGHSCVYSWFAAVKHELPATGWQEYRRRVAAGLRAATMVTAPSETMLTALKFYYGPFVTAGAVYNGRAAMDYRPGKKQPIVVTAGRLWDPAKNMTSLARIAGAIPWPIYAAGECQAPDGKKSEFQNLILLGQLANRELADWLSRAAIFALPARYEPFGLAALEAGLAGCVLVLGDIPSLREIWRDAALFVPPDDPDALSATLSQVIEDERLRKVMCRRSRKRALAFSVEHMAQGYTDLYRRLLEAGSRFNVQSSTFRGTVLRPSG